MKMNHDKCHGSCFVTHLWPTSLNGGEGLMSGSTGKVCGVEGEICSVEGEVVVERRWWRNWRNE